MLSQFAPYWPKRIQDLAGVLAFGTERLCADRERALQQGSCRRGFSPVDQHRSPVQKHGRDLRMIAAKGTRQDLLGARKVRPPAVPVAAGCFELAQVAERTADRRVLWPQQRRLQSQRALELQPSQPVFSDLVIHQAEVVGRAGDLDASFAVKLFEQPGRVAI